jgi:hypothetical protein
LPSQFNGTYFGHAMSKARQHATNEIELGIGMKKVSVAKAKNA